MKNKKKVLIISDQPQRFLDQIKFVDQLSIEENGINTLFYIDRIVAPRFVIND